MTRETIRVRVVTQMEDRQRAFDIRRRVFQDEQGVPAEVEQALKNAGSLVDRISGKDGDETRAKLSDMARRNQRFQNGTSGA